MHVRVCLSMLMHRIVCIRFHHVDLWVIKLRVLRLGQTPEHLLMHLYEELIKMNAVTQS